MNLVVFDPGLTTGYAIFVPGEKAMRLQEAGHLHSFNAVALFMDCLSNSSAGSKWTVLYEGFARGNSVVNEQLQTIETCGAIKAIASLKGWDVVMQYPPSRKGYIPVAKVMIRELFQGNDKLYHHAFDAVAHGLFYMHREGVEWQEQAWLKQTFQKR